MSRNGPCSQAPTTTRRQFVRGLTAAGVLTGLGAWAPLRSSAAPVELRGSELDLVVSEVAVDVTGRASVATLVNGSLPGPTLRWREGDTVTLRVRNALATETA